MTLNGLPKYVYYSPLMPLVAASVCNFGITAENVISNTQYGLCHVMGIGNVLFVSGYI